VTPEARESFGASSLATIVQRVAGYGIILMPEMAVASEVLKDVTRRPAKSWLA
jgi:LysR family transcriptional regulator, hydrogen peroxide-inducible genes activator